jgi:hypothetical protein
MIQVDFPVPRGPNKKIEFVGISSNLVNIVGIIAVIMPSVNAFFFRKPVSQNPQPGRSG